MSDASGAIDLDQIRELLRQVIDPEVGINIVDLGLIYGLEFADDELLIRLTMTSPACPLGDVIVSDIDSVLDPAVPQDIRIRVMLVWEPPWSPELMTPEARKHFGW
ncbi:MAG TPA: metal-sulfur cluster assembly factor [Aromatoleum sp.]|uniref:metal-sulfur cluster assembly factor n=1 Tax=Aromatoleum sp. TaxID=2307007 RepID=UPI002B462392|nr:metal-sulfur cluster assembly factor [Aromatoleum sp.]HJV27757.1 metal-sulfur cluster assembly factor [Aromatoleum sp.]